ncbi:MAG: hypothetical protein ABEL76_04620, partial [Bradymonadaceae bacterium]
MNRRLPLVAMLVLGLGSAASTGCSFDPSIGSSCSQEGRQMNGLVCRNGEWVRQFGADGAAPDTEVPRADGSSGEVGPSPDVPAVDGGPSDTGDDVSGPDDTRSDRPVGSRCTRDRACASGRCESFGARSVCTRPCGNGSPCPGASSTTCFQGTCTPEGFCRDPDGDGYGRGPGCKGPDGCAKCDPKARCKGSGANASCECQSGWIGDGTSCRRDGDGDGLADADERSQYGTDPTRADTDLDGLDDGGEVTGPPTTDPTETDSDGDFLPDGAETNR